MASINIFSFPRFFIFLNRNKSNPVILPLKRGITDDIDLLIQQKDVDSISVFWGEKGFEKSINPFIA
jgi:hypothetical protein